jgi:hypothetical protein
LIFIHSLTFFINDITLVGSIFGTSSCWLVLVNGGCYRMVLMKMGGKYAHTHTTLSVRKIKTKQMRFGVSPKSVIYTRNVKTRELCDSNFHLFSFSHSLFIRHIFPSKIASAATEQQLDDVEQIVALYPSPFVRNE